MNFSKLNTGHKYGSSSFVSNNDADLNLYGYSSNNYNRTPYSKTCEEMFKNPVCTEKPPPFQSTFLNEAILHKKKNFLNLRPEASNSKRNLKLDSSPRKWKKSEFLAFSDDFAEKFETPMCFRTPLSVRPRPNSASYKGSGRDRSQMLFSKQRPKSAFNGCERNRTEATSYSFGDSFTAKMTSATDPIFELFGKDPRSSDIYSCCANDNEGQMPRTKKMTPSLAVETCENVLLSAGAGHKPSRKKVSFDLSQIPLSRSETFETKLDGGKSSSVGMDFDYINVPQNYCKISSTSNSNPYIHARTRPIRSSSNKLLHSSSNISGNTSPNKYRKQNTSISTTEATASCAKMNSSIYAASNRLADLEKVLLSHTDERPLEFKYFIQE